MERQLPGISSAHNLIQSAAQGGRFLSCFVKIALRLLYTIPKEKKKEPGQAFQKTVPARRMAKTMAFAAVLMQKPAAWAASSSAPEGDQGFYCFWAAGCRRPASTRATLMPAMDSMAVFTFSAQIACGFGDRAAIFENDAAFHHTTLNFIVKTDLDAPGRTAACRPLNISVILTPPRSDAATASVSVTAMVAMEPNILRNLYVAIGDLSGARASTPFTSLMSHSSSDEYVQYIVPYPGELHAREIRQFQ